MEKLKKIVVSALIVGMLCACTGCGLFDSEVNELNGTIKGNTYNISFYSNEGENWILLRCVPARGAWIKKQGKGGNV